MPTPLPVKQTVRHFDLIGWAYQQTDAKPVERHVLLVLAIAANEHGICWPSQRVIIERTGLSERAIRDAINYWREVGVLTTEPRTVSRTNQYRTSTEYRLNPERFPEETYEEVPARGAGLDRHVVYPSPARGAAPKGIASEYPEEQLHVRTASRPRRKPKRSSDEDQLRGAWHTDDEATPVPADVSALTDPNASNGSFIAALIGQYRVRARLLEEISVTNKDAMAGYFMRVLKDGTDRQVLVDAVNSFFDQQIYDTAKGALWKQLLDALPRLAAKKAVRAAEAEADYSSGGARRRRQA